MPWNEQLPSSWNISAEACDYLAALGQEQAPGLCLQISVTNALTAAAELDVAFQSLDLSLMCYKMSNGLVLQTPASSLTALEGLSIQLKYSSPTESELEIEAPCLYGEDKKKPLIEQIRIFFNQEIAPTLAGHKGGAVLEELRDDGKLMIRFFGGCQGCSFSSVTLKNTIKDKIAAKFPQVKEVCDLTEHSQGHNPYA